MSFRLASLSTSRAPQAGRPLVDQDLEQLEAFFEGGHHRLAQQLDRLGPDMGPGDAQDLGHQAENALQAEGVLRELDAGLAQGPGQPADQAGFQVAADIADEIAETLLEPADQVAQEADRILDDLADHAGRFGQHRGQHRLQLQDGADHPGNGVECFLDQALVGGLQGFDAGVHG